MREPTLIEQLDDHLLQRRITREARESEKVLLDDIAKLREALDRLADATSDTLRNHPETQCCLVTKLRVEQARKVLEETR